MAGRVATWIESAGRWITGVPLTEAQVAERREKLRRKTIEQTSERVALYYERFAPTAVRRLFDLTAMDPAYAVIGSGRADNAFLLSGGVFELDRAGRSHRLKPETRSVWLRELRLEQGPFALLLVPDQPDVRDVARDAGAIVEPGSVQNTNSWGLRGPEPDPVAPVRGIVLGDSFMQGMFVGDAETPPVALQEELASRLGQRVSILNTGHIGYAPEQYHATLQEYGPRFRPQFVVVSLCPNDFGNEAEVMAGGGADWEEARHWLEKIGIWCRGNGVKCILAAVPMDTQFVTTRRDHFYPGRITSIYEGSGLHYMDLTDVFVNEHLRLDREARGRGEPVAYCPLYNRRIHDGHFSPLGSRLWGKTVSERICALRLRDR
jgi:hypothetical protein